MNANLFVFTNYVGTRETEESVMASGQILKLPDFNKFDGLVLVPNTIYNPFVLKKVLEDVKSINVPAVSLDRKIEGMSLVYIDSYAAEYKMVEHFIEHGYRAIQEVLERIEGKEIEEHELPCEIIYKESCGCQSVEDASVDIVQLAETLKNKYVTQQMETIYMADVVRGMTTDFAKVRTPEELYDVF